MKLLVTKLIAVLSLLFIVGCTGLSNNEVYSVPGSFLPSSCEQVVVGISEGWNNSHARLVVLQKNKEGNWDQISEVIPARLGSAGLVWGLGESPVPRGGKIKEEGDSRTPAGIFKIDHKIYAYDEKTPVGAGYGVHKITPYDLWVEDPTSSKYNNHLVLDHLPKTKWEKDQQMKQNDYAHKVKLFIHHNSPVDYAKGGRPIANKGSSIFFHIWRDNGGRATAGCTSLSEKNIMKMISLLDASKNPMYIILPRAEYKKYSKEWNLPSVNL